MTNSDLPKRAAAISALMDQIEELKVELKASFEIAANDGYNAKALKQAIRIHRMDAAKREKHDSAQSDLFLYLEEIEGRSQRRAAE